MWTLYTTLVASRRLLRFLVIERLLVLKKEEEKLREIICITFRLVSYRGHDGWFAMYKHVRFTCGDPHLREEKGGFLLTSPFVCAILYFAGKRASVKESFRLKPHVAFVIPAVFRFWKETFQFSGRNNPACTKNVPRRIPDLALFPLIIPFHRGCSRNLRATD